MGLMQNCFLPQLPLFYPTDFVINMDESALFYKAIPSNTYLDPRETRQSVRGTKALKAKDRLTLMFFM